MDGNHNLPDLSGDIFARASNNSHNKRLEIDVERYQHLLDGLDEDQREQVLRALWDIVVAFVDLGFGVHPMQQACGQLGESSDCAVDREADAIGSTHQTKDNNNDHAPDI